MPSIAALRGFDKERAFVNNINTDVSFNSSLKKYLNTNNALTARLPQSRREKADAVLHYDNDYFGASIKTAEIDFNQLDRRWLEDLRDKCNMSTSVYNELYQCIRNKSKYPRDSFIMSQYKQSIFNYISSNIDAILKEVFTRGDTDLKYFVVLEFLADTWYIAKMDDVIKVVKNGTLGLTRIGGNLMIGDYVSIQRKGGDGQYTTYPKSDYRHISNHIQFKVKPISILKSGIFTKI